MLPLVRDDELPCVVASCPKAMSPDPKATVLPPMAVAKFPSERPKSAIAPFVEVNASKPSAREFCPLASLNAPMAVAWFPKLLAAVPMAMAFPPLAVAATSKELPASAEVSPMTMLPFVWVPLETALVAL